MQIDIDKVIERLRQGRYYFDGQCEWSKHEEDNHAPVCGHFDCIKSFYINRTLKLKENEFAEIKNNNK